MPDQVSYAVLNIPLLGRNLAASRTPRLQPTVPAEYADMLSDEVARGLWSVDPQNGDPLHDTGQNLPQHLKAKIKGPPHARPHWEVPVEKGGDDEAEKVWLSGNITLQGQRLMQLEKFCGSKAAALVMWKEEAERFNAKAGSTLPGTKPSGDGKKPADNLTANPWSKNFRGDATERAAKINSIIKTGTRFAEALAKAAGTVVSRPLTK